MELSTVLDSTQMQKYKDMQGRRPPMGTPPPPMGTTPPPMGTPPPSRRLPHSDPCGSPLRRAPRSEKFAERFGQNLAAARTKAGISQEELGVRAGLHRTAVGQLERGERVARADTLVKLGGSLSLEPQELLEGLCWTPGHYTTGAMAVEQRREK